MSNLSIKAAAKVQQFNIKTIVIIFSLLDLFLLPVVMENPVLVKDYFYFMIYQVTIILGLFVGLRGQGRYKAMMIELRAVASNRDFDPDERDAILVPLIHHACLELGINAEERNKKYGLFKKKIMNSEKVPKKTKKNEVKKRMIWDDIVWKQFGYLIVGVWGFAGILLLDFLVNFWDFSMLSIITIEGIWYCLDGFIFFYIHYVFKIEPVVAIQLDGNTATGTATIDYEGITSDNQNTT